MAHNQAPAETIKDQFGHTLYHVGDFIGVPMYACPKCNKVRALSEWQALNRAHKQNERRARGIAMLRRLADAI